ncbi:FAD-dependent oxidoreductase [Duganella sp. BJB1802]|uniref:NAD(P)-binding protein n=1 Tax=Duganella sp. BJB1802 TaxID=2744575 RepID=UPI001594A370|nr:NAD(P)-binding protein [Duganella sp. BJB1802]NVD72273.1 FAD-dependent oxidoreductase [Duganella sp. BJB1802]
MSDADQAVLAEARASNGHPVFFLGCFERRVTFYSQQVRAFNLAHALISAKAVRDHGHMAIVGGGIAGATLAAAMAQALPGLKITIFEQGDSLFYLQRGGRDRFVHPHIFDWPDASADNPQAGLPLMDWHAAPSDQVVQRMASQFAAIKQQGSIVERLETCVEGVESNQLSARLKVGGATEPQWYDAVVLAIGFGREHHVAPQSNPSYWSPSALPTPLLGASQTNKIFISGNGDGGLTDFVLAGFRGNTHQDIIRIVEQDSLDEVKQVLLDIEARAWCDPLFDVYGAYWAELKEVLPSSLLQNFNDGLRSNAEIVFHTREERLFKRETAILNRFLAFLIIYADQKFEHHHITVVTNCALLSSPDEANVVQLAGEKKYVAAMRLLRFGPNGKDNLNPFAEWAELYTAAHMHSHKHRPATPGLTAGARLRWPDVPAIDAAPAVAPPADAGAPAGTAPAAGPSVRINCVGDVAAGASVSQQYFGK